jgi:Acyl-coenzyme A:6-aminopenicillanic acid acyl-transferase
MAVRVEERIVAGDEGDDIVVHHLVLRGSNRAIGRHLGELVRARYGVAAPVAEDPLRVRVQREWLRRNAPALFERMRGAADALGVDLADDAYDVTRLGAPPAAAACSAVFLPPRRSASGHPLVSRAFDLEGPLAQQRPGEPPAASRPYVLELHPDDGHASLALCAFDLLGAALDGVNSEGVVVAVASDLESAAAGLEPAGPSVGLDELQVVRHLLDACATAQEAREALLGAKLYYAAHPAHWLVADRHGDAFVFEVAPGRNRVHLVEADGRPLVATNHLLHMHPDGDAPSAAADPARSFARWRALAAGAAGERPLDAEALSELGARAFAPAAAGALRTLWHALYDAVERSAVVRFFPRTGPRGAEVRPHTVTLQLAA